MEAGAFGADAGPAPEENQREVLVVDDDAAIRRLLVRELSPSFQVVLASTLAEAMSALNERGKSLAAIVTDKDLGSGQSGLAILEAARERGLRCARVLVSGGADDELAARLVADRLADATFGKPWQPRAVTACLAHLLDHPS